jgi:hypothetical protein
MANKTLITEVEGPNRKVDLYELAEDGSAAVAVEYGVEFNEDVITFLILGGAYIEAA